MGSGSFSSVLGGDGGGLPLAGSIVLSFDAEAPGTGNQPLDTGTYDIGRLSSVQGAPGYTAGNVNGPNGGAYWFGDAFDGYWSPSGGSKSVTAFSSAVVFKAVNANAAQRFIVRAASTGGGGGGVTWSAAYNGVNPIDVQSGQIVRASSIPGQQWYVGVHSTSTTGSTGDLAIYDLGSVTPTNTVLDTGSYSGSGFGDHVRFGYQVAFSQYALNDWGISQFRTWDAKIPYDDFVDVAQYFKDFYGL